MELYRVQIASNGRMVLPVGLRRQMHIEGGGLVLIRSEAGRIVLESIDDAVARAQAIVRKYSPDTQGVVDELISERRAEAAGE